MADFINGKMERVFRTFRIGRRLVPVTLNSRSIQHPLDAYRHWYHEY